MPDKLLKKIQADPVARTRFVADVLNVLEKHGVNVNDPQTLKKLGLDQNLNPMKGIGTVASTVIVTLVM
jgi:hypothetical protein